MHFAIYLLHLSKVVRLPQKSDARSYEVLHLSRKIILANLKIWCSKMPRLSGNQRPDLTSLMKFSLVLRLPRESYFCRSSQMFHACHRLWKCHKTLTFFLLLAGCSISCTCHTKRRFNVQKWREQVVLCTFWLGFFFRAFSRHNFEHLSFQKWSEPVSF